MDPLSQNIIPFSGMLPPPLTKQSHSFPHTFQSDKTTPSEHTVVLKVGSSSLTREDGSINISTMSSLVELISKLRQTGHHVILVSSGAVSVGCQALKLTERPKDVITKQAIAAVGQGSLVRLYSELFSILGYQIAQVLLSRSNLSLEHHYLNSLNTFKELLRLNVIPIVNENDTLAVDELHFGDNDTLSAYVASLVRAEWLFLLTDVDALYTANPNANPDAKPIRIIKSMKELKQLGVDVSNATPDGVSSNGTSADRSGQWGTGGMKTKLEAAKIATSAGVRTCICSTSSLQDVMKMLEGDEDVGTQFLPSKNIVVGRKKWIAQGLQPIGSIVVDQGASIAIQKKSSLFAAGLLDVYGTFPANCCVRILRYETKDAHATRDQSLDSIDDCDNITDTGSETHMKKRSLVEIGRGLCNYNSKELRLLKGLNSCEYGKVLSNLYWKSRASARNTDGNHTSDVYDDAQEQDDDDGEADDRDRLSIVSEDGAQKSVKTTMMRINSNHHNHPRTMSETMSNFPDAIINRENIALIYRDFDYDPKEHEHNVSENEHENDVLSDEEDSTEDKEETKIQTSKPGQQTPLPSESKEKLRKRSVCDSQITKKTNLHSVSSFPKLKGIENISVPIARSPLINASSASSSTFNSPVAPGDERSTSYPVDYSTSVKIEETATASPQPALSTNGLSDCQECQLNRGLLRLPPGKFVDGVHTCPFPTDKHESSPEMQTIQEM